MLGGLRVNLLPLFVALLLIQRDRHRKMKHARALAIENNYRRAT